MKRAHLNFLVDAVAFAAFAIILSTGFLLRYVLPHGSGRIDAIGPGWRSAEKTVSFLWGYTRQEWGAFHFWASVVLVAVMALHVFLHWRWIVGVLRGRRDGEGSGTRFGLGVVGLIAVIALGIAPFVGETKSIPRQMLNSPTRQGETDSTPAEASEHTIQGSMTLGEVEQATGVPVAYILEKLGLSDDTSPDERIGRLRRSHDFEMDDVRRIVAEYRGTEP